MVTAVVSATSSADMENYIFRNITFDIKYDCSSDGDETEDIHFLFTERLYKSSCNHVGILNIDTAVITYCITYSGQLHYCLILHSYLVTIFIPVIMVKLIANACNYISEEYKSGVATARLYEFD